MVKISKTGSTIRQVAYARRVWSGNGNSKKQIALDVGYSPAVSNSAISKIESRPGFNNAMAKLAADSGNIALSAMHELKSRGFKDFSNQELISSLNAISAAWDRFNKGLVKAQEPMDNGKNRLRTVVLQRIENQTNIAAPVAESVADKAIPAEVVEVKEPDF